MAIPSPPVIACASTSGGGSPSFNYIATNKSSKLGGRETVLHLSNTHNLTLQPFRDGRGQSLADQALKQNECNATCSLVPNHAQPNLIRINLTRKRCEPVGNAIVFVSCARQEDVPDGARVVCWSPTRSAVRGAHGHRTGGQQAVPVRVPPFVVAGGR